MNSIYYFAAWTDSGFLLGCDHEHQTVTDAVACISCAGGYVIAVENNVLRALTDEEEAECQCAPRLALSSKVPELAYEASGYAVMVRVRFVDGWGWDTWMRFDTYEQAIAHARNDNRIVPFGSVEWTTLRQSRERQRDLTDSNIAFSVGSEPTKQAKKSGTFIDWVLEWTSKWEAKELERIYSLQVPARIEALRKRRR